MAATPLFVFDAYGTLFDVHAAIAAHRTRCGPHADRLSALWRAKQLEYTWTLTLAGEYIDFWTLTQRALDVAVTQCGVGESVKPFLLEAYFKLSAFSDARTTLERLKAKGAQAAILSNGTPAMLTAAIDNSGLRDAFDAMLSVDAIKIYKPRAEVYALVTDRFGHKPQDVIFVSSNAWDVMGATRFGFRCIWINRSGQPNEYPGTPPYRVIADLNGLADLF